MLSEKVREDMVDWSGGDWGGRGGAGEVIGVEGGGVGMGVGWEWWD